MKIKTKDLWIKSGKKLEEFLSIDDFIDFDIVQHIFQTYSVVWNGKALQRAEASQFKNGKPFYMTIEDQSGCWVYTGMKRRLKGYCYVKMCE